jgi:broad specificity phosphatase PhoE
MATDDRPTTLILVRHGQTESNIKGLLHGQTDVPLTARGVAQARLVAARLARERGIAALYTSPLERARHTAELIGAAVGLRPTPQSGLMEIHFGVVEGLTFEEVLARHPELGLREDDDPTADLLWPGGESRHGFRLRVAETLRGLLAAHAGETIVAVAHGGAISVGVGELLGEPGAGWRRYMVANCAITRLEWVGAGRPARLACLDDRAHLADLPPAGVLGVFERGDADG